MSVEELAAGLTKAQREAMPKLKTWGSSSYSLRIPMNTLRALERKGIVTSVAGVGSMWSPQTAIKWKPSPTGLAVRSYLMAQDGALPAPPLSQE